jgi:hypothetical protein
MDFPITHIVPFLTLLLGIVLGRWVNRAEEKYKEKKRVRQFHPLVLEEKENKRFFTWPGRDPLHLIETDLPDRQLYKFFIPLCEALRQNSGMEPQFNSPTQIRGEIVYELSSDFRSKWRLLGGYGGDPGDQVLVLISR